MKFKIFGDSHARYFSPTREVRSFLKVSESFSFEVNSIRAASVKGFGKRDSTLKVSDKIIKSIDSDEDFVLVLAFGQVDLELGFFYQKYVQKERVSFSAFFKDLLDIYFNFIKKLPVNKRNIICKGVNLPVLVYDKTKAINYTKKIITENTNDDELINGVLLDMKNTWPTALERTCWHLAFNHALKEKCAQEKVRYFDINEALLCDSSRLISTTYIPPGNDHHIVDSLKVRCLHIQSLLEAYYLPEL